MDDNKPEDYDRVMDALRRLTSTAPEDALSLSSDEERFMDSYRRAAGLAPNVPPTDTDIGMEGKDVPHKNNKIKNDRGGFSR